MLKEILEESSVLGYCIQRNGDAFASIAREYKKRGIRFVILAARGTSDHAAVYGKYLFETVLGIPAALAAPSVATGFKSRLHAGSDTLFIGISQSGEAEDVLETMRNVHASGALTVSITNECYSPLAKESGFSLLCYAGAEKSVAATKTFSATLQILAGLIGYLQGDQRLIKELMDSGIWIREVYKKQQEIDKIACELSQMNACTVLSRGLCYAIALEMALKLKECAYVKADAMAISDFMHGPIAAVGRGETCFIIADKGPFMKQYLSLVDQLMEGGTKVVLITNDALAVREDALSILVPDSGNPIISPMVFATTIQFFACMLALSKDLNPDEPRNLKKVTITF